jgi:hypothetical protein
VSKSVPVGSNNLEAVKEFAEPCGIPIASLSEELTEPSFMRGRRFLDMSDTRPLCKLFGFYERRL